MKTVSSGFGPRAFLIASVVTGVLLSGCSKPKVEDAPPLRPAETARVAISQGSLIGGIGPDGTFIWRGIPFAAPPVGDLRWRPPALPPAWNGTRQAVQFGAPCLQVAGPLGGAGPTGAKAKAGEIFGSEDCLFLNVWAPKTALRSGAKLPVMFWIHGGANTIGDSSEFDFSHLASSQNVIVVAVNYRLAPFGWFALGAIRDTASEPDGRTANFGVLDQVAALKWVKENIPAFGGDPARVTIFGQSAGGINVASLLVAPQSKGLFSGAIMESGGPVTHTLHQAEWSDPHAPDQGTAARPVVAKLLKARKGPALDRASSEELASWLRKLPAHVLLEEYRAQNKGKMGMLDAIATIDDGVVIPEIGLGKALASSEYRHPVPLMTGTNRDELKIGLFFSDDLVHSVWYLARWPKSRAMYDGLGKYIGAAWRVFAVDNIARQSLTLGMPVYAYRFDWADEGRVLLMDLSEMIGASHNIEVPFVSGDFKSRTSDPMHLFYNDGNEKPRLALSAAMMSYWAEFAYSGAPGRGRDGKLPLWRSWAPGGVTPNLMVLDTAINGGPHQIASELTTKSLYEEVERDGSLDTAEKRCAVFQVVKGFFGGSNADIKPFLARNCPAAKPS